MDNKPTDIKPKNGICNLKPKLDELAANFVPPLDYQTLLKGYEGARDECEGHPNRKYIDTLAEFLNDHHFDGTAPILKNRAIVATYVLLSYTMRIDNLEYLMDLDDDSVMAAFVEALGLDPWARHPSRLPPQQKRGAPLLVSPPPHLCEPVQHLACMMGADTTKDLAKAHQFLLKKEEQLSKEQRNGYLKGEVSDWVHCIKAAALIDYRKREREIADAFALSKSPTTTNINGMTERLAALFP